MVNKGEHFEDVIGKDLRDDPQYDGSFAPITMGWFEIFSEKNGLIPTIVDLIRFLTKDKNNGGTNNIFIRRE